MIYRDYIRRVIRALTGAELEPEPEERSMTDYTKMTDEELNATDDKARTDLAVAYATRLAIRQERVRRSLASVPKGKPCAECYAPYGEPHNPGCTVVDLG